MGQRAFPVFNKPVNFIGVSVVLKKMSAAGFLKALFYLGFGGGDFYDKIVLEVFFCIFEHRIPALFCMKSFVYYYCGVSSA